MSPRSEKTTHKENIMRLLLFWRDEEGAIAVEYGLVMGLIAVVVMGSIGALGHAVLDTLFNPAVRLFSA